MNVLIQVHEIFPSINEIIENEDDNIILVFIIQGEEHVFNMIDLIEDKITISLKLKDNLSLINYEIYRNANLICEGEFFPFNDIRWLNSKKIKYKKITSFNLIDLIRLKMKCLIINEKSNLKGNVKKNSKLMKKSGITNNKSNKNLTQKLKITSKNSFNFSSNEKSKDKDNNNISNKNNVKLSYNKSIEDINNLSNTVFMPLNQISIDDSIQLNNPLFNSTSGRSNTRKKSSEKINIKRLNSQIVNRKTRKQTNYSKNLSIKSNSSGTYKTSASSIRENSKEKINNNHHCIRNNNIQNNLNYNLSSYEKKFDFSFKSIDETIIDKQFENEIQNDDILCFTKKTNKKIIDNEYSFDYVSPFIFENEKSNDNIEENNINSNFENYKSDFEIFYTSDYLKNIENDVINLELQLLIEKIFEIQESYHFELGMLRKKNSIMERNYNLFSERLKFLTKKYSKLVNMLKSLEMENYKKSFKQNNIVKSNFDLININIKECNIWRNMLNNKDKKKKLFKIFHKVIFKGFENKKKYLNNSQKLICEKLNIKYNNNNIKLSNQQIRNENLLINKNPIFYTKSSKHFKSNSLSYPPKPLINQSLKITNANSKTIRGFKTNAHIKK